MQSKTLIVLIAGAIMGASSTAMAKGGGGGGGGKGMGHFHGHFHNHFHFGNRFLRNQGLLNDWSWGGGWGWGGYGDNGRSSFFRKQSQKQPQAQPVRCVILRRIHSTSRPQRAEPEQFRL